MTIDELDAALGGIDRVYIDTSVCIAFHSQGEIVHPAARHLFHRIADEQDPLSGLWLSFGSNGC